MSPELKQAVEERVALGHTKEQIASELQAAGYDNESIEAIYAAVTSDVTQTTHGDKSTPTSSTGKLIGYGELISGTFALLRDEWRLLMVAAAYLLGLLGLVLGIILGTPNLLPGPAATVITFLVAIAGLIGFLALSFGFQRALLRRKDHISYTKHVISTLPQIIGIILVSLYVQFATSVGYLLLVIPGIVLSIYLVYAILVKIDGSETGIMALVRSTQLVYRRWWGVLGRLLFAGLTFSMCVLPIVVVAFVVLGGIGLTLSEEEVMQGIIGLGLFVPALLSGQDLFFEPAFNLVVLLMVYFAVLMIAFYILSFLVQVALVLLYESLRDTVQPFNPEVEKKVYFWMKVLVIVGIPVTIYFNLIDSTSNDVNVESLIQEPTQFQLEQAEVNADMQAELEAFQEQFQAEFESN